MSPWRLLVAGPPGQYTGGYLYDQRMAEAISAAGQPMEQFGLAGRFPDADADAGQALEAVLTASPDGALLLLDGLVMGALPQVLARHAARLRLVALVHHPLADEWGLDAAVAQRLLVSERRALQQVRHVVVTSAFTARRLAARYGVPAQRLSVVEPGLARFDAAPRQRSPGPPRLLCVATLVPRKGHLVLLQALARIKMLDWRCDCVGDDGRDLAHAQRLRAAIAEHGLQARVRLLGALPPHKLQRSWERADLFVLASHYEGYGMVITEALAHGLPVVCSRGGALVDTLPEGAGVLVAPGDAAALAAALTEELQQPQLRVRQARRAREVAAQLPDWAQQGQRLRAVLERVQAQAQAL